MKTLIASIVAAFVIATSAAPAHAGGCFYTWTTGTGYVYVCP